MEEAFAALDVMPPGFRLLADLSGLEFMEIACAPFIGKVMDRCQAKGIGNVVRVIPDPQRDIGLKILGVFHYDRHVRIVTCENLAQAEAALNAQKASSDSTEKH